jgi:hypothetical protein
MKVLGFIRTPTIISTHPISGDVAVFLLSNTTKIFFLFLEDGGRKFPKIFLSN